MEDAGRYTCQADDKQCSAELSVKGDVTASSVCSHIELSQVNPVYPQLIDVAHTYMYMYMYRKLLTCMYLCVETS